MNANPEAVTAFTPPSASLEVIDRAIEVLREERSVFLSGTYERLPDILSEKAALLEKIERLIHTVERSARLVAAVRRLIDASRRNEEIIRAAQQGLANARRRLKAIEDMNSGAVAYSEDGKRITSRADQMRDRRSA